VRASGRIRAGERSAGAGLGQDHQTLGAAQQLLEEQDLHAILPCLGVAPVDPCQSVPDADEGALGVGTLDQAAHAIHEVGPGRRDAGTGQHCALRHAVEPRERRRLDASARDGFAPEARKGLDAARQEALPLAMSGQAQGVAELVEQHAGELRLAQATLATEGVLRAPAPHANACPHQSRRHRTRCGAESLGGDPTIRNGVGLVLPLLASDQSLDELDVDRRLLGRYTYEAQGSDGALERRQRHVERGLLLRAGLPDEGDQERQRGIVTAHEPRDSTRRRQQVGHRSRQRPRLLGGEPRMAEPKAGWPSRRLSAS
jgi:hypothetical protein